MATGITYFKAKIDELLAAKLNKPSGGTAGQALILQSDGSYAPGTVASGGSGAYTDEQAQDAVGAALVNGTHTGITVTYNDAGNTISLALGGTQLDQVIANLINTSGSNTRAAVASVAGGTGTPTITNTSSPSISGNTTVGGTLTALNGTWSTTPDSYAYQWLRNGAQISGATSQAYVTTTSDANTNVAVRVTALKAGYTASSAVSATVAIVPASGTSYLLTENSNVLVAENGDTISAS